VLRKLLREPLVHFLVLGRRCSRLSSSRPIAASEPREDRRHPGKVEHLVTGFSRTWRRPPTARSSTGWSRTTSARKCSIARRSRSGLDKDDTIVRRRMRQKLEFLAGDATAIVAPTDQELQAWLERNPDKFRVEPSFAFSQIYFNRGRDGESAPVVAAKALAKLERAEGKGAAAELARRRCCRARWRFPA
jgi:hypothetical protein